MPISEAQKRARYKYEKKNLKRIPLDVQQLYYSDVLKPAADAAGEPVNTFIKNAIQRRIDQGN